MSTIQHRPGPRGDSWRVVFRLDGRQRVVTFASERAAQEWRAVLDIAGPAKALVALTDQPASQRITRTVRDQVLRHVDRLTGVQEGTRRTYRGMASYALGDLGDMTIDTVTRDDVAAWVNARAEASSGKTLRNQHALLAASFTDAVRDGLLVENVFTGTRMPRTDHDDAEMVFLTPEEFARLHAVVSPQYQALVVFAVGTGARFGEITALQRQDIDMVRMTARIRRAWKHTGRSARVIGPPKSKRSNRTVRFGAEVAERLEPLLAGERRHDDWLFTTKSGGPIGHSSFWRHAWAPAVRRFAGDEIGRRLESGRMTEYTVTAGPGKRPRFHDLRHTFASWAIQRGIPLPVLQRQLGHESITTTVDRYGHLAQSDFDPLAALTDDALAWIVSAPRGIEG